MALKAIKCTQCSADLQLDDQKEIGYCLYCGTKILIRETININHHHSGVVKIDNSDKASNCLRLADQAYLVNNYLEAYNYYTKVLEYDSNSYHATFKKGMSAARLSQLGDIRYKDLVQGYRLADAILRDTISKQTDAHMVELLFKDHNNMTTEMKDFALDVLQQTEIPSPGTSFNSREECEYHMYVILDTLLVLESVYSVIDPSLYEDYCKSLLEEMICLCDKMSHYHLKYVSGYTRDNNGRLKPEYTKYLVPDKAVERFMSCRAQCVNDFNNLPSNVSRRNDLAEQLQALADEKAARAAEVKQLEGVYKSSVQAFWNENAELFSQYKAVKNKTWYFVLGGVGVCALLICAALIQAADIMPYGVPGAATVALSAFIRFKVARKAAEKFEEKVFSDELKKKKSDYMAAVAKYSESLESIKKKEQEKKSFEATLKR